MLLFSVTFARSEVIKPLSYTFDRTTGCDNRCYDDYSHTKLIDGFYGSGAAQYQAGEGWIGWNIGPNGYPGQTVNIDFVFSVGSSFNSVEISSISNSAYAMPTFELYKKNSNGFWDAVQFPISNANVSKHLTFFSGFSVSGESVRLKVASNDWALVDEVIFNQDNSTIPSVPEPASYLTLLLGLGIFFALKRGAKPVVAAAKADLRA